MKVTSVGKKGLPAQAGFSVIELVIALALLSLVMGGVVLSSWSSTYWAVASETSNEGLYKAKTRLEDLRAQSLENFFNVTSEAPQKDTDASCVAGGLCYFVGHTALDLSACAKYAQARVSWQVTGYPTTSASLFTTLANPTEILAEGADCLLAAPKGAWGGMHTSVSRTLSGTPSAIDALSGTAYVAVSQSPYLSIVTPSGVSAFTNGFALEDPVNSIDVARNASSGRTYAYMAVASTSNQFQVVDVTSPQAPFLVASVALASVDPYGSQPEGWRVAYYKNRAYVTTLETAGPELHIFDVSTPESPLYLSSLAINISVYAIAVRDESAGGSTHTLAYLATANDGREIAVFDMTDGAHPAEVLGARTDVPGAKQARSIFVHGAKLFIGLKSGSGEELYAYDASQTLSATHGLSLTSKLELSPRSVGDLFASGEYLFLAGVNASPQLQVRKVSDLSLVGSVSVTGLIGVDQLGFDIDGDNIYALSSGNPQLRVFESQ